MNKILKRKNFFLIGIKGVGMTNLALVLKKMGKNVAGWDVRTGFITSSVLKKNKINFFTQRKFLPSNVDAVVYTAAHGGASHPLVFEAKKRGIPFFHQIQVIAEIMSNFKYRIAVCGSHGKTTTASLLAYALCKLGQLPSYIVGTSNFGNYPAGDYYSTEKFFVVEGDEYALNPPNDKRIKLSFLPANWVLATNIDFDHPDVYSDLESVKKTFFSFFRGKNLILNVDDKNLYFFWLANMDLKNLLTIGYHQKAKLTINRFFNHPQGVFFELKNLGEFFVPLFGFHNVLNSTLVIGFLLALGFNLNSIKEAISTFPQVKRRLELIYKGDFLIFDDYAHHPKEIEMTVKAVKKVFKERRIVVVFQPHTYSRTIALEQEFARSLSLADKVYMMPIFPSAREKIKKSDILNEMLISRYDPNKIIQVLSEKEALLKLEKEIDNKTIVITMGAGDVYKIGKKLVKYKLNNVN